MEKNSYHHYSPLSTGRIWIHNCLIRKAGKMGRAEIEKLGKWELTNGLYIEYLYTTHRCHKSSKKMVIRTCYIIMFSFINHTLIEFLWMTIQTCTSIFLAANTYINIVLDYQWCLEFHRMDNKKISVNGIGMIVWLLQTVFSMLNCPYLKEPQR